VKDVPGVLKCTNLILKGKNVVKKGPWEVWELEFQGTRTFKHFPLIDITTTYFHIESDALSWSLGGMLKGNFLPSFSHSESESSSKQVTYTRCNDSIHLVRFDIEDAYLQAPLIAQIASGHIGTVHNDYCYNTYESKSRSFAFGLSIGSFLRESIIDSGW